MRIAWKFDNYDWPINPSTDSGWDKELLLVEKNPIGSTISVLHDVGAKSARRQISGYMIGVDGPALFVKLNSWFTNGKVSTLIDHHGMSKRARLVRFKAELIMNRSDFLAGRPSWHYDAEFIEMK